MTNIVRLRCGAVIQLLLLIYLLANEGGHAGECAGDELFT